MRVHGHGNAQGTDNQRNQTHEAQEGSRIIDGFANDWTALAKVVDEDARKRGLQLPFELVDICVRSEFKQKALRRPATELVQSRSIETIPTSDDSQARTLAVRQP